MLHLFLFVMKSAVANMRLDISTGPVRTKSLATSPGVIVTLNVDSMVPDTTTFANVAADAKLERTKNMQMAYPIFFIRYSPSGHAGPHTVPECISWRNPPRYYYPDLIFPSALWQISINHELVPFAGFDYSVSESPIRCVSGFPRHRLVRSIYGLQPVTESRFFSCFLLWVFGL